MALNKIEDMRNHLFAQLERLNDEEMKPEKMQLEIAKSKVMASIGSVLVNSAKIEVDFLRVTGQKQSGSQFFKNLETKQIS